MRTKIFSAAGFSILTLGIASIAFAQEEDPLDAFRKASEDAKKEEQKTDSDSGSSSSPKQPSPTPRKSSGGSFNLYCSGEIKRSTGSFVVKREQFEFRTVLDLGTKKHKVVNVVNGPLFSTGSQYDALRLENNIIVLGAEINGKDHWKISSVRLDLDSSKLSGTGTVDLTEIRSRLSQRLRQRGSSGIPEGGLDAQRKIQVDGSCQSVG